MLKKEKIRKQRKVFRVRKSIVGSSGRPRLTVFRSLNHIYAQLIDDSQKITLVAASTRSSEIVDDLKKAKTKTDKAHLVGALLAKKALEYSFNKHGLVWRWIKGIEFRFNLKEVLEKVLDEYLKSLGGKNCQLQF